MKAAVLAELRAARAAGRSVVLATWLDGSDQRLIDPADEAVDAAVRADEAIDAAVRAAAAQALARDQAIVIDAGGEVLVEPHHPAPRLVLVGAVHIAAPLSAMAAVAGFAVTIVDPRRAFATEARFPGQRLVVAWPDVAIASLAPDARTAIVTLTHDAKLDDPAIVAALASPAAYVGCLGSQKTHAARRVRLAEAGVGEAALARLRAPVGLRIGARSPAEIAVSILAEIIATLRGAA